ncbi:hypothetical protein CCYN49044_10039 [Capnocytophaga cynodegmi]|uniref:Uncharacterized protein n=1 Tax=Capnocytophaga cynodegmi TaxID=28189 RepID=A0A0B7HQ27_9FLAO|nr:hypothetical protein CCYN49044_10039 [Capnocytophaga cynodegmi]CEN41816.1 hypothetical protein CCYN74_80040 [Capnocytophaga cynodegmi]
MSIFILNYPDVFHTNDIILLYLVTKIYKIIETYYKILIVTKNILPLQHCYRKF